jgi:transcriptional regulator of nitric oxide reductase
VQAKNKWRPSAAAIFDQAVACSAMEDLVHRDANESNLRKIGVDPIPSTCKPARQKTPAKIHLNAAQLWNVSLCSARNDGRITRTHMSFPSTE